MAPRTEVAFLGTGTLGSAMVLRLLSQGIGVTVWNRTPGKLQSLLDAGATAAASPRPFAAVWATHGDWSDPTDNLHSRHHAERRRGDRLDGGEEWGEHAPSKKVRKIYRARGHASDDLTTLGMEQDSID